MDFSYAFATPHRITVGRPDSSDRTLLDLQAGSLRMPWTYEDLTRYPLAAFVTPANAYIPLITCPMLWLSPTNDFLAHIDNMA